MNDDILESAGLTRNQFLIWLGQRTHPESPQYNGLSVAVVDGVVDRSTFGRAVQTVVDNTDALRTVLRQADGFPKAEVLERLEYTTSFVDLSLEDDPDAALDRWEQQHVDSVVDLTRRSFEFTVLKLAEARYAWGYLQHHIFSDATSMTIVFNRISECYQRLADGDLEASFSYPQYADYLDAERGHRQSDRYQRHATYWESKTADPPDPLAFYEGRSWSPSHGLHSERLDLGLGVERSEALRRLATKKGIRFMSDDMSLFSVFLAAYFVFLFRISGQETIALGVPWHNRRRQFRETVGLIMEQNPFVVRFDSDDTFESLIGKIRREAMDIMRHLPYPAGNPGGRVYDATFNYAKVPVGAFAGMPMVPRGCRPSEDIKSIGLQIYDFGRSGEFSLSFEFNSELFDPRHREAAIGHFMSCLDACLEDETKAIGAITILTEGEQAKLLEEWNATGGDFPDDQTVVDLFEAQVARRPAAVAASCEDNSLTYRELDQQASALAARLTARGVEPGVEVGVCLERSLDILIAVLGVLKTGGAYVPLDPAFPMDRLEFMLEDSGTSLVLTQSHLLGELDTGQLRVLCLDQTSGDDGVADPTRCPVKASPDDLAYVLYTSGSTGRPKGVEVSHRALTNFLWAMRTEPGLTEDDTLLALTTLSFDIAGLELFLPLIVGGHVEIATSRQAADGRLLLARLESGDVTALQATPATWRMILDAGWSATPGLKALIGGEALPPDLVAPLMARTKSLWNMYGPTETTIWSSVKQISDSGAEITIGKPIANTTFRVLDRQLQPVPVGIPGELFIGGDGLARGYRGRPVLTAERFIPDPFEADPEARMYRTGDLVRYRPDGELVHLGRLDSQVKVRGFRIEVGEIESVLADHPSIQQVAVVASNDESGRTQLVAYCVTGDAAIPSPSTLRNHLRQTLPDYMVPHRFVGLDEFPLTPNGKLNRRLLPEADPTGATSRAIVAPRSPVERSVAELFVEVLAVPQVSIEDDFFDLGGDSLLALRLMMGLEEEFRITLPLHVLYDASTIAQLADVIHDATGIQRVGQTTAGDRPDQGGPSTTERRLIDIWIGVLGVESVSTDEGFDDLQGTPDLLAHMLAEVRDEFGVIAEGISIVDFEADPTIAGLAKILDNSFAATSSLVVPLQPRGCQRPLFLIHAGGGYVFFYRALAARLGPDRPVYGVRAMTRADDSGRSFDQSKSVKQLAASYIEEIRTIQKDGPYLLGGASFGGVIAFEMAHQLAAGGEPIESPVLLFDAFVAKPENWSPGEEEYGAAAAKLDSKKVHIDPPAADGSSAGGGLTRLVNEKLDSARSLMRLIGYSAMWQLWNLRPVQESRWALQRHRFRRETFDVVQLKTMEYFLEVTYRLLKRYRPVPYRGRAVLFRTQDGYNPEPGWRPLILGTLDVHTMPGTHLEMLEEPGVIETAELVQRHLATDEDTAPTPTSVPQAASADRSEL